MQPSSSLNKYILALDQGTTSSRAILFDKQGKIISLAQKEFTQFFPQPGWVEHDAMEIWSSQMGVAAEAVLNAGLHPSDVAAIGITNQRETTVIWEATTGLPIYPAIVWQDRRTADFCDQLKAAGWTDKIRNKTGLIIDAYFSATKAKWILDHVPGAREKAQNGLLRMGTIDTWLLWKLTNGKVHATDVSNASRTMLFNIHQLEWDADLLQIFDIPAALLPQVRSSSEIYGHTEHILTSHPIPIAGMAGDQQAALFGQQCTQAGMVKNTYGTGCFMLMNTGDKAVKSQNNLLTTIAWQINGTTTYALEGSVFMAGAVVQWLRDGLKIIRTAPEIEALAQTVRHADGVYFVPAFAGLGAPYWDQHARGSLLGLTRGSTNAHIARAALDSIAFQTVDLLKAMEADAGIHIAALRVDGGATANNLLMQIQSDVLQTAVTRPITTETTALGAAYLAGLAVGYWWDTEEIQSLWQMDRTFEPALPDEDAQAAYAGWQQAVAATRMFKHS